MLARAYIHTNTFFLNVNVSIYISEGSACGADYQKLTEAVQSGI